MLTITAVRDDNHAWLKDRKLSRHIIFAQDVFNHDGDAFDGDRLEMRDIFVDDICRVTFIDGDLRVDTGDGWFKVDCDYEIDHFLTNADVEFIFAWNRLMHIPTCIFTPIQDDLYDKLHRFDDEIAEAQCTVLFQVLPRDLVRRVFEHT